MIPYLLFNIVASSVWLALLQGNFRFGIVYAGASILYVGLFLDAIRQ